MVNKPKDLLVDDIKPDIEDENIGIFDKAEYLQQLLINMNTQDGPAHNDHYVSLRNYFIKNKTTKQHLPDFVIKSRDLQQFW